jgi:hypothetical protein
MNDIPALAGQTFYRGLAAPSRAGSYSYIGIQNPAGSGINVFFDAMYPWPGFSMLSTEYGIQRYATPFNEAPFQDVFSTFLCPTKYGAANSKTVLWGGTYPDLLNPQQDYVFQCAPTNAEPNLIRFPYPIIITPGDGIALWNTYMGHENKAGLWVRECPIA